MSYKGSERFEREEQEIEFITGSRFVVHADISTCFPSIYTHSLPWAIHGKRKAKLSRGDLRLAGNILDVSAQAVRDSQTNGLLIGPHASNVLSEIILTSVDAVIIKKGYTRTTRHIDDYKCYVRSPEEAESFVRDLGLALREYELSLNEKKTRILPLPRPQTENWIRELHAFQFSDGEIRYSQMRHFLDLALHLSQNAGSSAVLNYAFKMMPDRLNERARRLFTQEAVNLALAFPYLSPLLGEYVFKDAAQPDVASSISSLCNELLTIGVRKIYPDSIAWALFYAIRYDVVLKHSEADLKKIVPIDDCISDVLLLEYSRRRGLKSIIKAITARADNLKGLAAREQDGFWLLIYQLWSESDLRGNGQQFLAELKKGGFQFVRF